ncbi:hypothetical protein [Euzebya sp.]|uniref:hypothetical protein n=1 Tax=Euzebya sp. TaxID=1971409 RepID=UPI003514D5CC
MRGFGPRELVLVLLRRMADLQPDLVADARSRMGAGVVEQRDANRRWQAMLRSGRFPGGVRRYAAVLGAPDATSTVRGTGIDLVASRWALGEPWPDLEWQVVGLETGEVVTEGLVRAAGRPAPAIGRFSDMPPWSAVLGEVMAAHPDVRQADPLVTSRWALDLDEGGTRWRATFTWGLLQVVEPLPRR